jgi:GDP-L-fucose synthase
LDLRNQKEVEHFFISERPQIVIDAAARVGGILANNSYP